MTSQTNDTPRIYNLLLSHALHQPQTKFSRSDIEIFCKILSHPIVDLENVILDHLLINQSPNPHHFIRLFKSFTIYLKHPRIDTTTCLPILIRLDEEWEGLKVIREYYLRLTKNEQSFVKETMYALLEQIDIDAAAFVKSSEQKHKLLLKVAVQYQKGNAWCIKTAKALGLQVKLNQKQAQLKRKIERAKLRLIFVKFLKKEDPRRFQTEKLAKNLGWLVAHTKSKGLGKVQTKDNRQSNQESKSQSKDQVASEKVQSVPISFSLQLQEWNRYSHQPIDISKFQPFYNTIIEILLSQEKSFNNLSQEAIGYLKSDTKFNCSVFVTSLAIFVQIYNRESLNCSFIKTLFPNMNTLDVWRPFCSIMLSCALDMPATLKDQLFVYEKQLFLHTIKISDYIGYKEAQIGSSSQSVISAFVDRMQSFLCMRFVQFDRVMKVQFSWFYQTVLSRINYEHVQFMEAHFDQILIFCVFYGMVAMKVKADVDMVDLIKSYRRLDSTLDKILKIDQKSIVDVYNSCFSKFINTSGALLGVKEKPILRSDFMEMIVEETQEMKQQ